MREAVEALVKRKFGKGGVYSIETPDACKDSAKVRGSANPITEEVKECVALQAQYIYRYTTEEQNHITILIILLMAFFNPNDFRKTDQAWFQ
jgi:hypothetical protein